MTLAKCCEVDDGTFSFVIQKKNKEEKLPKKKHSVPGNSIIPALALAAGECDGDWPLLIGDEACVGQSKQRIQFVPFQFDLFVHFTSTTTRRAKRKALALGFLVT